MEKKLNDKGYPEQVVSVLKDMNGLLSVKDNRMVEAKRQAGWITATSRTAQKAFSFYLGYDIPEDEEVIAIDTKHQHAMASGFMSYYFQDLYKEDPKEAKEYDTGTPLSYHNKKYDGQKLTGIYAYDINKAYLSCLEPGIYPDTFTGDLGPGIVGPDEIGFHLIGYKIDSLVEEGEYALARFKKGYSPLLQKFAVDKGKEMEKKKKQGKRDEVLELKGAVNILIGRIRNKNVWFHAYVVCSCNRRMEKLMNEDTILCNTDSIFSLTKREDLPIGTALGQFKVVYEDVEMRYKGSNYAISKNGVPLDIKHMGVEKALQDAEAFMAGEQSKKYNKYRYVDYGRKGAKIYET